jgi:2-polyprenyl-3-methyl-5-hydroxy-6-metoxy-1,4-benzoquinol methylase
MVKPQIDFGTPAEFLTTPKEQQPMNRKQRRATLKAGSPSKARGSDSGRDETRLFFEAVACEHAGKFDDAVRIYKRVLLLKPDHAEACNNLGRVLQAQGKAADASIYFARSLALMPQLLKQYAGICATLVALLPTLEEALRRQAAAWPKQLGEHELFGDAGLASMAGNPLLLHLLQSLPVQDIAFEHLLTSLRASLLKNASTGQKISAVVLDFACALAKQCYVNEYVFATTPEEDARLDRLNRTIEAVGKSGAAIEPIQLAVLAMYRPLHGLGFAQVLIDQRWTPAIDAVLTQQIREPARERTLRQSIPRLTPIEDEVSKRVQQQYEENPYPRWVHAAGHVKPVPIDQYLRDQFPASVFTPLGKTGTLDMLIAGCGTGQIAIASAQKYSGAQALAVDLSLSSLCYAKRSTPADLSARIEYAQADILKLASIGRSFDVIDASGVLHHMANPLEGWRILLSLLRPGGLMHLGLYSVAGRKDVVAARAFIAGRGYGSTPDEIRRCRQDLLNTPLAGVTRFTDFFTTSECRDLLFHVHEARMTIPAIAMFMSEHHLKFLGFEFEQPAAQHYRNQFAASSWSPTDLDHWREVETKYPDTFAGMYQFWVQKP